MHGHADAVADDADGAQALRRARRRGARVRERRARGRSGRRCAGGRPRRDGATLAAAPFDRRLDCGWRRTSYSDITAGRVRGARGERAGGGRSSSDEPRTPAIAGRRGPAPDEADAALARGPVAAGPTCRAGVRRGDVRAPGPRGDRLRRARPRRRAGRARRRGAGLAPAVELGDPSTRSSPGCGRRSRRRSGRCVGGVAAARPRARRPPRRAGLRAAAGRRRRPRRRALTLAAIAARPARAPPRGDPLAGYAERLDDPALRAAVRGYLTGSIDLVVRTARRRRRPRFAVVDYKTNWLGRAGRAADRLAPPPRRPRRGDGARPLRAAGAALHRRAAPLPALAPAGLRRPSATSPASCTCSCAGWSGRTRRRSTARPAACSRGGRRPRWSRR